MNSTVTTEEMLEYVTLKEKTPETIRFVARINVLLARDEDLRRRIEALETLYDSITLAPTEQRKAFLADAVNRTDRQQQQK